MWVVVSAEAVRVVGGGERCDVEFGEDFVEEAGVKLLLFEHVEQLPKPVYTKMRSILLLLPHMHHQVHLFGVFRFLIPKRIQSLPSQLLLFEMFVPLYQFIKVVIVHNQRQDLVEGLEGGRGEGLLQEGEGRFVDVETAE